MIVCKGYCETLKDLTSPNMRRGMWGIENMKRCSVCEKYFIVPYHQCQCCGCILRTKPHSKRDKDRLRRLNE